MKKIVALRINCHHCHDSYLIPMSADARRARFQIDFARCPHCGHFRRPDLLMKYWGEKRCWACHIPFSIYPEHGIGLCGADYLTLLKQRPVASKEAVKVIIT